MTPEDKLKVRGDPDKRFFIDNLIKDIELIPAILDLVDNSVDSARALAIEAHGLPLEGHPSALPPNAFEKLEVALNVQSERFEVSDNCAGISVDVARNYAFRIGRAKDFQGVPGSVGQFGVGMKRALFKLGRRFRITSQTMSESFVLDIDVDDWVDHQAEGDWSFEFSAVHKADEAGFDSNARGTRIVVEELHDSVIDDFSDPLIISLIREQLRLRHQEAIDRGLTISLNGETLRGLRPMLLHGPDFAPIRKTFILDFPDGNVHVELLAGIVASDRKELGLDENNAENFTTASEAGWWVFCNDRLLLIADKTTETGWGRGAAAYHPQYRLFRGYLFLSSLHPQLLPWNTSKTAVDTNSSTWRRVQGEMVGALAEVQGVLNRMKKERGELAHGQDDDETLSSAVYLRAASDAVATPLRQLPRRDALALPTVPKARKRLRSPWQRIQYDAPRDQVERAMSQLKFATMAELGRRSFDYFYKREVEDGDL